MKILLTGKYGQVGFELQRSLSVLAEAVAVDQAECDLADAGAIRALVREVRPTVIVTPAAFTAVYKAESEVELARAINALAPGVLGEEAEKLGALVVHYSTDYVFDGTQDRPYVETDGANPQSVYGRTKFEGEQALMAATHRCLILRTSWVVGAHGNNFAKAMLRLASERESLQVVADQWGGRQPRRLCWRMSRLIWFGSGVMLLSSFPTAFTIARRPGKPIGATTPAMLLHEPWRQANQ